jgi:hypothetical protein
LALNSCVATKEESSRDCPDLDIAYESEHLTTQDHREGAGGRAEGTPTTRRQLAGSQGLINAGQYE